MIQTFQHKNTNLFLLLGFVFLSIGILMMKNNGLFHGPSYLSFMASLLWFYKFTLLKMHGYVQLSDTTIQINHGNLKGLEGIAKNDIIHFFIDEKIYDFTTFKKKRLKIYKKNLPDYAHHSIESFFQSINLENKVG